MNSIHALKDLTLLSKSFPDEIRAVAEEVLTTEFGYWSGSSKNTQHHYGKYGLATHTLEVIQLMFDTNVRLRLSLDKNEIFLSGLFHDAGKLYDYAPVDAWSEEWTGTPHKRLIHHISRGALIWSAAINTNKKLAVEYHDKVLHNILAHHGQRKYGSPVMPKTRCAWLLHLADSMSARMADCDNIDFVHYKKE